MTKTQVEANKVVSLVYSIRDQKDELFEYSNLPINYLHGGRSDLFEKIEQALDGKQVGDKVTVQLSPEEGFGDHDSSLTFVDDIENVPEELRYVGAELEAQNAEGKVLKFMVSEIKDDKLTVDANHPMAGQTVTFEVEVKSVRDATSEELKSGKPASGFDIPLQ